MHTLNTCQISDFTNSSGQMPGIGGMMIMNIPVMQASHMPGRENGGGTKPPMRYMENYNEKYKDSTPAIHRDDTIKDILAILQSSHKPNPLLTGPAGCGKTAIVKEIARLIANNDPIIPKPLEGCTIWSLPIAAISAGKSVLGEMEESLLEAIAFFENPENKAILFLDEIHQLTSGHSSANTQIVQIMKPALAGNSMHCIGATTTQEAKTLMTDPAFNRRFIPVNVPELDKADTQDILESRIAGMQEHYHITIPHEILPQVISFADRYSKAGWHRPDNAITLMDRASSDTIMERMELAKKAQDKSNGNIQIYLDTTEPILTAARLKSTASRMLTGDTKYRPMDWDKLKGLLSAIKGQDAAIKEITDVIRRANLDIFPKKRPESMLFAGPSGCGKTEIAKILAKSRGQKAIILNMTEFSSPISLTRIIGASEGYVGYGDSNELPFDILDTNPCQVIVLDEFEKCHETVKQLFMSALEEGRIVTNFGKTIDFSKSIVIATTNAGAEDMKTPAGFNSKERQMDSRSLSHDFKAEIVNRFGCTVFFSSISKETYREILSENYSREIKRIREDTGDCPLPDNIPQEDLGRLTDRTYNPAFNARPAYRTVRAYIEDRYMEQ